MSAKPIHLYSFTEIVELGIDKDKGKNKACFQILDKLGVHWKLHAKTKGCVIKLPSGRFQAIETNAAMIVLSIALLDAKKNLYIQAGDRICEALFNLMSAEEQALLDGMPAVSHITDKDTSCKISFAFQANNNLLGGDLERAFYERLSPAVRTLIHRMKYIFDGETLVELKLIIKDVLSLQKAIIVQVNIARQKVNNFILLFNKYYISVNRNKCKNLLNLMMKSCLEWL